MFQPGWASYLLSGTLAVLISWVFTGCRLGNSDESPTVTSTTAAPVDTYTGLYETLPQSVKMCATLMPDLATQCQNLTTNQVPLRLSSVIDDPVGVIIINLNTAEAVFVNPWTYNADGTPRDLLPTIVDANTGEIAAVGSGSANTFYWFTNSSCTRQTNQLHTGQLNQYPQPKDFQGSQLLGRMSLKFEYFESFTGDCTTEFAEMLACFDNQNSCPENEVDSAADHQLFIQDVFSPYINAGVMTTDDITNVRSIGYEVTYE